MLDVIGFTFSGETKSSKELGSPIRCWQCDLLSWIVSLGIGRQQALQTHMITEGRRCSNSMRGPLTPNPITS